MGACWQTVARTVTADCQRSRCTRSTSSSATSATTPFAAHCWSRTPPVSQRHPSIAGTRTGGVWLGPLRNSRSSCPRWPSTATTMGSGWPRIPACAAASCSGCAGATSIPPTVGCRSSAPWCALGLACSCPPARPPVQRAPSISTRAPSTCSRAGAPASGDRSEGTTSAGLCSPSPTVTCCTPRRCRRRSRRPSPPPTYRGSARTGCVTPTPPCCSRRAFPPRLSPSDWVTPHRRSRSRPTSTSCLACRPRLQRISRRCLR